MSVKSGRPRGLVWRAKWGATRRAQTVIDRQVGHMTRLVDDLLDVTRISRGKIQLQRESLDFTDVVRRAVEDHRALFVTASLDLQVTISEEPIRVHGDRTRVAQVVGNLLGNAAKFTQPGGRVTIIVEANEQLRQAVVRVRDTGPGIAPEMLPRIFEPFTQADTTLDRSKGGLGLGLTLCKGIMTVPAAPPAPTTPDPRLPAPGTLLQKKDRHGAVRCECTVEEGGIRYADKVYRSLSSAAMAAAKDLGLTNKTQNLWCEPAYVVQRANGQRCSSARLAAYAT